MKYWKALLFSLLLIFFAGLGAQAEYFTPTPNNSEADSYRGLRVFDFSGGLNNQYSNHAIKDNELSNVKNFELSEHGALKKRKGYTKISTNEVFSGETSVYSLLPYYDEDGTTKYLIATTSEEVFRLDEDAGTWESLYSGLTADKRFQGAEFNNTLYFGNGSDYMLQFNGTTVASVAATGSIDPPIAKYITLHKRRLWAAGNSTNPSRVWFTQLNDGASWEVLNYFDVDPSDGTQITGLSVSMDSLVIFKENSIFLLYGTSGDPLTEWSLKRINADVGCIAPYSIKNVGDGVFFVSSKKDVRFLKGEATGAITGLYTFDNLSANSVSAKIQTSFDGLNSSYWSGVYAENFGDWYILAVPYGTATYNNDVYVFDILRSAWTRFGNMQPACFATYEPANTKQLYWGSSVDGFVYYYDTSSKYDVATETGTVDASSVTTITDNSQAWTTDELKGATLFVKNAANDIDEGIITGNSTNEITIRSALSEAPTAGISYEVGAINTLAYTKYFDLGMPEQEKKFREMQVFLKSTSTDLSVYAGWDVDFNTSNQKIDTQLTNTWGSMVWGEDAWGVDSTLLYKRVLLNGIRGKYIRYSILNCEGGKDFSLYGFSTIYQLKPYTN